MHSLASQFHEQLDYNEHRNLLTFGFCGRRFRRLCHLTQRAFPRLCVSGCVPYRVRLLFFVCDSPKSLLLSFDTFERRESFSLSLFLHSGFLRIRNIYDCGCWGRERHCRRLSFGVFFIPTFLVCIYERDDLQYLLRGRLWVQSGMIDVWFGYIWRRCFVALLFWREGLLR